MYLGLVEDDEFEDYDTYDTYEDLAEGEPEPQRRRSSLRRVPDEPRSKREGVVRAMPTKASNQLHVLYPVAMKDAQELGDKFRDGYSVIMNLQSCDPKLRQRIFDYACGLVHGLGGAMDTVADMTWIITPSGVQVSVEEGRRFLEERGFFGQV